jgi:hypothetical protein
MGLRLLYREEEALTEEEKIEHKQVRVIFNPQGEIPSDVQQENELIRWAESLYAYSMCVVAAGVLKSEGSLDKAASVLEESGFHAPYGYIERHYGEEVWDEVVDDDTAELQLWVENEAERIAGQAAESVGYYLAVQGKLTEKADKYLH